MTFLRSHLDTQVDGDNPWPGLAAFDERATAFFHGRDDEVARLLQDVLDNPVTVLYGRSGLGKMSLLRAGLFPRLREHHLLPTYIRFDVRPHAVPLINQLRSSLLEALTQEALDAPPAEHGSTTLAQEHALQACPADRPLDLLTVDPPVTTAQGGGVARRSTSTPRGAPTTVSRRLSPNRWKTDRVPYGPVGDM